MPPSSTIVHEGQYDISRVSVSWLIRAGGNPPPHKYRLHYLHILASYSPPRAVNFKEGDMGTFFLQDLGLALVTNTCPHRPQAIKRAKNGQSGVSLGFFFCPSISVWTRRLQVLHGMSVRKCFHANIRKSGLPMVNLKWNMAQKPDPTLEPSNNTYLPKICMFSAENSICPRYFIRDGPELL